MRINTNISAIVTNNQLAKSQSKLETSLERLSSGYKINRSADDPAGMAISQKMKSQIRGLSQATDNTADGISVVQTAEGAMVEIQSMLSRMKELCVQAANDVNSDTEREAIQTEIDTLNSEIDRIASETEFNTQSLINGNLERRVYSDVKGVNQLECSSNVVADQYGITVTQDARQAIAVGDSAVTLSGTVPDSMAGTVTINGYKVAVSAGDDINTIVTNLMSGCEKIGGSLFAVNSTVTSGADATTAGYTASAGVTAGTSKLVFMTDTYGSSEKITITCDNASLASALGITSATTNTGLYAEGSDVQAKFTEESGKRVGFADSATLSTNGTQITVKDLNNKTFVMDVPGNVAGTIFDDTTKTNSKSVVASGGAKTKEIEQEVTDIGVMKIHVGANENQIIELNIPEISAYTIGTDTMNVMTNETASKAIDAVDAAITKVSVIRAQLGAVQNRLDHTTNNLEVSNENLTTALSTMIDTDMAEEMTTYTSENVLSQAATSMLAQANERPADILQLLQ